MLDWAVGWLVVPRVWVTGTIFVNNPPDQLGGGLHPGLTDAYSPRRPWVAVTSS